MGGELLPILGKMRLMPGVAGVDYRGEYLVAKAAKERRGWVVLPWDIIPSQAFGEEYSEYLLYWNGGQGKIYTEIWTRPIQMGPTGQPTWEADTEGYLKFLRELAASGAVGQPHPALLQTMVQQLKGRIDRAEPRAATIPMVARQLEQHREELRIVQSLLTDEAPAPQPTSRKRRASK